MPLIRTQSPTRCRRAFLVGHVFPAMFIIACVTSATRGRDIAGNSSEAATPAQGWYNVLLPDEIRAAKVQTAYEAIARLRPRYLARSRFAANGGVAELPVVIIDRGVPETVEALRQIPAELVFEIRFVEPTDAVVQYGAKYGSGVIVVRAAVDRRNRPRHDAKRMVNSVSVNGVRG